MARYSTSRDHKGSIKDSRLQLWGSARHVFLVPRTCLTHTNNVWMMYMCTGRGLEGRCAGPEHSERHIFLLRARQYGDKEELLMPD